MTTCCLCTAPATHRTTAMCCDQKRERGTPMCARHACTGCEVAPADAPPLIAYGARCTECDMESEPCTRCQLRHAQARIAELESDVLRLTTGSAYARLEDAHKALADRAASYIEQRDEAVRRAEAALAWDDNERSQPETAVIYAAHPVRSGKHDLYAEAMRLVGARRSKGALVDLVNWLLVERGAAFERGRTTEREAIVADIRASANALVDKAEDSEVERGVRAVTKAGLLALADYFALGEHLAPAEKPKGETL